MKMLKHLVFVSTVVFATSVWAHGEGHGNADIEQVTQAAQTTAKMLTFKDKGMSVGKLDSSWNSVGQGEFELVEETQQGFIVKATNKKNQQTLFFKINKLGTVLDVKDAKAFSHSHGHAH